ncbi:sigma-70 family RNA polymerase sigma factor [Actinomadura macra]|uniref:sigma-70 family RNA polymerase sigma factor n=1 Tax=Actinomadura macra TaxID=46164 RepID=UPI000833B526|nr:sigma-70 family RNA polymerase sigma factor [Actinomadura macra]
MRQDFLDFVDAEYALVVRFVMYTGASLADARDAAQHMALQGWRKVLDGVWDQVTNPPAWARTVALNHHRAQHRNDPGFPLGTSIDPPEPGPDHAELTGQARDLVTLLRSLDADCRSVFAFDLDGFSSADIAAALNITRRKVLDLRAKARRQLKRHPCITDITGRERRTTSG